MVKWLVGDRCIKKFKKENNFLINKATYLKYTCYNICHVLIFVRSKNNYFSTFSQRAF